MLGRLREVAPGAVTRDGELLVLGEDIRLDVAQFREEARQALSLGVAGGNAAVALARSAIARYRGDLLLHDLYEDWADVAREDTRRTMLDLLDLCAQRPPSGVTSTRPGGWWSGRSSSRPTTTVAT